MSSANQDASRLLMEERSVRSSNSTTLPSQPKSGSSEALQGTPVRPKPCKKNTIPVIISGVHEKFKSRRKLMGESRQYHPSLNISRIKELPKGDFVAIGDSMQDVIILQNESKMRAALGKNVKISLPKAFTGFCPESITFPDLHQGLSNTTPQTKLTIPVR